MNGFLEEKSGMKSLVRFVPFTITVASVAFGILAIIYESDLATRLAESFLFAATGTLGIKAYQKSSEK